ncbi:phosphate acetyltransferase [Pseudovibrio sp. SPO723]|uniref:phosphate acetyltransferase n=1 Tax=Nesiotobacter zosterae TaxID=392721 RepID=UPI0029C2AA43|nr:phosphate acetyltransferase [Pseudovibrio sp. SPO723]MDX5591967.1 phosphate acetyltransferase [Pseudovibrio sp. SPO723]
MKLELGAFAEITRSFSSQNMSNFARQAGTVPGHYSTVPGPLIGALFSYLLGVKLPGRGTNYLKQDLNFLQDAPLDEPLTARVTVTRLRPEKHLVDLATVCTTQTGTLVCEGRALVYVEDVGKE